MAIETINIEGSIEKYLDNVSDKTVIIGSGYTIDNIFGENGEELKKGRAVYLICGGVKEPMSDWRFIDADTNFQCVLTALSDALDVPVENKNIVFVTANNLNIDEREESEKALFEELSRKAGEKGLNAVWGDYDTESEENKRTVSRYIREKAADLFDSMTDYYGCPLQLFEYEVLENDSIEQRLDEKSNDILILSVPVNIGDRQYISVSMMRLVVNNTAKLLIYEGNETTTSINEATLNGMLTMAECLAPAKEGANFTVYLATQYKLGFSSDSSRNRTLCDALYNAIKERGYKAIEIKMNEANKDFKKRQYASGGRSGVKTKSDVIRNYIFDHKRRAIPINSQFDDPCISAYIIENYL